MSDIDRIKDKLAKLLRLGENAAATDGEIENALNLATQMMAKHQLTRDDIDTSAPDPLAKLTYGRHVAFCKGARASTWECALSQFIVEFIGSIDHYLSKRTLLRKNGITSDFFKATNGEGEVGYAPAFYFYGPDDDARCAASMFEELRDAIATMAILRWNGWARGEGMAYAYGFADGLIRANRKARLALKNSDSTTTALILKSEQTSLAIVKQAKNWLSTAHKIKLTKGSSRSVNLSGGKAGAYSEGVRDGSNYKVGRHASASKIG